MNDKRNEVVLRDDTTDRTRELMVLNAIAAAVAESLEPEPLLASALDHVLDLLEFDAGGIYTREDDQLHLIVHRGIPSQLAAEFATLRPEMPYVGRMVDEHQSLALPDLADIPSLRSIPRQSGLRSLLGLPLFARGEHAGLLIVFRVSPDGVTLRERRLLEASADHIALALDNARLFVAEQRRRKQSEALREGALALTAALGPDEVLRRIVEQAGALMEAPLCAIYEYDAAGGALALRAAVPGPATALGRVVAEAAIAAGQATCVSDLQAPDAPHIDGLDAQTASQAGVCSVLAAPLLVKGRAYGGIVLFYPAPRSFRADELQLIDIFADQAALALEHARLIHQSRQLAALEERQRIARDLHDSVSQTLFSLTLAAQAARTTIDADPQTATGMLETVQELATGALAEMRALIFELRPGALHEAGLAAALERFVGAFRSRTGIQVQLELDERRLPVAVEEALYRIAGEALNNVSKHAAAGRVEIRLARSTQAVRMTVRDDGVGFPVDEPITGDHMGRQTMQERASALGGSCRITSVQGQGTMVEVDVPFEERD